MQVLSSPAVSTDNSKHQLVFLLILQLRYKVCYLNIDDSHKYIWITGGLIICLCIFLLLFSREIFLCIMMSSL